MHIHIHMVNASSCGLNNCGTIIPASKTIHPKIPNPQSWNPRTPKPWAANPYISISILYIYIHIRYARICVTCIMRIISTCQETRFVALQVFEQERWRMAGAVMTHGLFRVQCSATMVVVCCLCWTCWTWSAWAVSTCQTSAAEQSQRCRWHLSSSFSSAYKLLICPSVHSCQTHLFKSEAYIVCICFCVNLLEATVHIFFLHVINDCVRSE